MRKFLSVIVVFNSLSPQLSKTFESIKNQTFKDAIEIVPVCTSNIYHGSNELLKSLEINFKRLYLDDNGIYSAINLGIKNSAGDYSIIFGAGDAFSGTDSVEILYSFACHNNYYYLKFDVNVVNIESELIYCNKLLDNNSELIPKFHHQGIIIHKNCYNKFGFYSDKYKIYGDFDLFLKIYLLPHFYIDRSLTNFIYGGISTPNIRRSYRQVSELFLVCKNNNALKKFGFKPFLNIILRGILGVIFPRFTIFLLKKKNT